MALPPFLTAHFFFLYFLPIFFFLLVWCWWSNFGSTYRQQVAGGSSLLFLSLSSHPPTLKRMCVCVCAVEQVLQVKGSKRERPTSSRDSCDCLVLFRTAAEFSFVVAWLLERWTDAHRDAPTFFGPFVTTPVISIITSLSSWSSCTTTTTSLLVWFFLTESQFKRLRLCAQIVSRFHRHLYRFDWCVTCVFDAGFGLIGHHYLSFIFGFFLSRTRLGISVITCIVW